MGTTSAASSAAARSSSPGVITRLIWLLACAGCAPSGASPSATFRALRASDDLSRDGGAPSARSEAPGAPGAASVWAPARKSFLGTSLSDASRVYFSGHRGAVTEVFYPVLDAVQTTALELLVGDAAESFVDAEMSQEYTASRLSIPRNRAAARGSRASTPALVPTSR
jgi:glucoamylase